MKAKAQTAHIEVEMDADGNTIVTGLPKTKEDIFEYTKNNLKKTAPGIDDDAAEKYAHDVMNGNAIRKLDKDERVVYGGAITRITNIMPAFRDAIAHLRPYMDITAGTAYVDQFSRVAVSPWWIHSITNDERAGVLLHESMHVMNNHFDRQKNGDYHDHTKANITQDMEINTTIQRAPEVKLPEIVVYPEKDPYNFDKGKSFEQYYALLDDMAEEQKSQGGSDGDDDEGESSDDQSGGGSSSQSDSNGGSGQEQGDTPGQGGSGEENAEQGGNGSCDSSTEAREAAADEAGVEKASKSEQTIMKSATADRIRDELARSRAAGTGHMDEFYRMAYSRIYRPVSDWKQILRKVSSSSVDAIAMGRSDYSYRRTNRRMAGSKFIHPGMVQYKPTVMLGVDISGSMQQDDKIKTIGEAESLLKELDKSSNFRVFPVDTEVGKIKTVRSVKELSFYGGGGTQMEVAFDYVKQLPKKERPDFFALATDGGTDWNALLESAIQAQKAGVASAILVTTSYGHDAYKQARERIRVPKGIHIIDCSKDIEQ